MKYLFSILVLFFAVFTLSAQEYKTYKKVNDSTFVETRSYTEEGQTELTPDQTLRAIFRELDRWARIENRHLNNALASQRVFNQLRVEQVELIPDTTYLEYNRFRDTLYSYPSLQRDTSNNIIYDSDIKIGDTTYNVQAFRNGAGAQVMRLEEPTLNISARFIESDLMLRVGANTPLPQLTSYVDLYFIGENNLYRIYYARTNGTVIRMRLRKR